VPDAGSAIRDAVREALGRADLVITTGGLGPTSDDRTRDLIAGLLETPLVVDAAALANIARFFTARGRSMPESTAVQARVPAGALVLQNDHGTAPGLILEVPPGRFRAAGFASGLLSRRRWSCVFVKASPWSRAPSEHLLSFARGQNSQHLSILRNSSTR
jgi:nicotinamide-nucleotide amidase